MSLKKFLAVLGVLCVLVACIAIPASSALVVTPGDVYSAVPYELIAYSAQNTNEGSFTFPSSVGIATTITAPPFTFSTTSGDGRGFSIRVPSLPSPVFLNVRLASPVAFPMNNGVLSTNGDKFFYDVDDWEATADYVVQFPDGTYTRGTYDYRSGVLGPDGREPSAQLVAHVRDYLQSLYPTASYGFILSLELEGLASYSSDDAGILYGTENIYRPLTSDDLRATIFDGNVGAADLLLSPLEAFFNFEIFPNFTLGDIFGVIISILLFVVILKLFAGG